MHNHGKTWTEEEHEACLRMFHYQNKTYAEIAEKLGRSEFAIECRIANATPLATNRATIEESNMIKIETKTFVNGTDIATLSREQLFALIAKEELAMDKTLALRNKPDAVKTELFERQSVINKLVRWMDANMPHVEQVE
jgi:hypothetical protein